MPKPEDFLLYSFSLRERERERETETETLFLISLLSKFYYLPDVYCEESLQQLAACKLRQQRLSAFLRLLLLPDIERRPKGK